MGRRSGLTRWAWVPIPLLLLTMVVLYVADLSTTYEAPHVQMALNFLTRTLACLFVVYLAGQSFLVRGAPGLLLLGCGVAIWGGTGLLITALVTRDANLGITISNLGAWLSALCFLVSVVVSLRSKRTLRPAELWLGAGYTLALGVVGLVALAAWAGWLPVFFVPGQGGTVVRHVVLGSAIAMLVLTAVLVWEGNRPSLSPFAGWYLLALLLIAVGLCGLIVQASRNTALDWTCRVAQYLSGTYMLIAALGVRKSSTRGIALGQALGEPRYRYGVAIAIVLAAAALRLALFQSLGTRSPFITFFPAVMLAALYGGFRAGLLATLLSALAVDYFWLGPVGLTLGDSADWLAMIFFVVSCAMISGITSAMHRAQARAANAEAEARLAAERARSAEALRESEERLRLALDAANLAAWDWHMASGRIIWNDEHYRVFGYEPGSIAPGYEAWRRRVHPEDIARVEARLRESMERGGEYAAEYRAIWPDGAVRWVSARGRYEADATGKSVRSYGVLEEITERKRAEEALRQSEELNRKIVQNTSAIILRLDPQARITFANERALQFFGYSKEELVGQLAVGTIIPAHETTGRDLARMVEEIRQNPDGFHTNANENTRKNGERVWLEWTNSGIYDEQGRLQEFLAVGIDVTERKRAEEALAASRNQLQDIINNTPALVYAFDLEERFVVANSAVAELLNSTPEQMIGKRRDAFMPKQDANWHEANDRQVFKSGKALELEEHSQLQGRSITWLTTKFPLRDAQGRIYAVAGISADVSQRKQAEAALRESEERYRGIIETSEEGIATHQPDGTITYVNQRMADMLGYPREEVVGKSSLDFVDPQEREAVIRGRESVKEDGRFSKERKLRRKDGSILWTLSHVAPQRDHAGNLCGYLAMHTDITERKRMEEALRESEAKFRGLFQWMGGAIQICELIRDEQGRPVDSLILEVNPAYEQQTGLRRAEVAGRRIKEILPVVEQSWLDRYGEMVRTGKAIHFEEYNAGLDRWFDVYANPMGGNRFAAVFADITERKRSEGAMSERARLLDLSYDAIVVRDAHDRITYWNKGAEEIYGYSRAEALGQVTHDLLKTEFPEPLESIRTRLRQDNRWTGELTHTRRDGTRVTVASRWSLDRDPQRQPAAILETNTDITERKRMEASLRESERHLRALAESILNLAWWANGDGYITWYNRRWYEYTGTTPEQMEGWGWKSVHDPQALPAVMERWQASIATGEPFEMTFPLRGADGKFRRFLNRIQPLKDAQGQVVRWFGTNTDVEELKCSEEALRQSEDRLRLALQVADFGTWDLDLVTGSAVRSLRHDQIFGYEELQPEWTLEIALRHVLPEDRLKVQEAHARADETGGMSVEARVRWADGSIHWINSRGRFHYDSEGRPVRIIGIVADITERKQAEEALRKRAEEALRMSEQEFRSLAEAMPQIVWATRPDGWNIYFNQQWVDYTGMTMEESYGHGWNAPFHPDDKQRAWEAWQRATQHDERYSLECRLRRADGVYRWWLVRGEPMRGANGEILKWFGTCTDIEEIKQAQAALREANDLLEQRVAERTAALRASEEQYRLLFEAAHDGVVLHPLSTDRERCRFVRFNAVACRMLGYSAEEMAQLGPLDIQEQAELSGVPAEAEQMERARQLRFEKTLLGKDGRRVPAEIHSTIFDLQGQMMVLSIIRDITERKQAEAALQHSESLLRSFFDAPGVMQGIVEVIADDDVRHIRDNTVTAAFLGLTPDAMKSKLGSELGEPRDILRTWVEQYRKSQKTNCPITFEYEDIRADQKTWLSVTVNYIGTASNGLPRFAYVVSNITDRKRAEESLLESEERFRVAQELSPDGFSILRPVRDSEGRIVDFTFVYENAAIARINGTDPATVVGRRISEFMPAHSQSPFHEAHAHVADTGETCIMERKYDGGDIPRPTWFRVVVVRTGQDIAILSQDITERKQAEEAVRQSEEQFRALAETITNLAWWANADGYITWYNRRWYEYTGTTPQQMEGWGWQSVHDPQALPAVMEQWKASIATGQPFDMTFPLRGADGVFRRFLTRIQPVKDAQGRVVRWFGTNTDVEELKRSEEALREAEQRLRFALETSHTGAWDLDLVDHTAFRSLEHDRVFGYPELLPQWTYEMFLQHLLPEDRPAVDEKFGQATATQGVWDFECRIRRADGEVRWIWGAGRHRTDAAGGKRRMAGIVQDITERKRAEERIQTSLREKEVMLKEIHHRVKNNLQVIASLVDLQADDMKEPGLLETFADIRDRVRSMALVHEKLYQSESLARVNFADYMQSLLSYLSRSHGKAGTTIHLKSELHAVLLSVDKAVPCGLMISELVSNAYKHAFRGRTSGEIRATLSAGADGRVYLRMGDNGVGLPAGLDWRQCRSLGLRLIRLLSEQLHAVVEVRSGDGTEFEVVFEPEKSIEE
jgi:PAS domain S-box-containing protein